MNKKYKEAKNLSRSQSPLGWILPLAIVAGIIWFGYSNFLAYSNAPSDSPKSKYSLEVKQGDNFGSIGERLANDKALNQSWALSAKANLGDKFVLLPGKYSLNLPSTPDQIMTQLSARSKEIESISKPSTTKKSISITLKEGVTADDIITKLSEAGISTKEELIKVISTNSVFGTKDYEFLPTPLGCQYGTKDCVKYYLEGYLYPDTYDFYPQIPAKDAIAKLLNNFQAKAYSKLSTKPKDLSKAIIMASVIEKETGRPIGGINSSNLAEVTQEKNLMAGVFYNRLENNQKWQSDPTVTYGTGKSLCQRTLKSQTDCLYLNSPESENKYSTYSNVGYPIGAITSPTLSSIEAAINPSDNEYLFFVSDASGKKYFAKTNDQHESNISKADEINKQYRN